MRASMWVSVEKKAGGGELRDCRWGLERCWRGSGWGGALRWDAAEAHPDEK